MPAAAKAKPRSIVEGAKPLDLIVRHCGYSGRPVGHDVLYPTKAGDAVVAALSEVSREAHEIQAGGEVVQTFAWVVNRDGEREPVFCYERLTDDTLEERGFGEAESDWVLGKGK